MTVHLYPTIPAASGWGDRKRGCVDVVPVVVSRHSSIQLHGRSLAIFRILREGTDPAARGRGGWQLAGWRSGDEP